MWKSIILAVTSVFLYGAQNVVIEQKLTQYNALALLVYLYIPGLVMTGALFTYMKFGSNPILAPSGAGLWIAIGAGVAYFLADYFLVLAYKAGADSIAVTSVLILMPMAAMLVKYVWKGGLPNRYQLTAYVLVVLALYLFKRGGE